MLRPNYALDPPPDRLTVGGRSYRVATDWRTWLIALELLKGMRGADGDEALRRLAELEELLFGGLPEEDPGAVLDAVAGFLRGYPGPPAEGAPEEASGCSLEWDLNEIVVAIRDQHGVDLSWRGGADLHWWEFLLLARTLCGDHYILRLAEIRTYRGSDRTPKEKKRRFALPRETGPSDEALLKEIGREFYGA